MPLVSKTFDQLLDFTRTSSATFVGSNGLVQSTPASVNLLTWTQQFDNAAWTKTRATVTANATVAPDGTSTADKLVEDTTASSSHFIGQSATYTSGTTYTVSVSVKAAERNWFAFQIPATAMGTARTAYFDVSNGTVGTVTSGITAAIVSTGNGWYRCSVTFTPTASVTATTVYLLATADNSASYTGDGTSGLFVWGAQLEVVPAANLVLGSELVTNGTFTGGSTTGWTAAGSATISGTGDVLTVTNGATAFGYAVTSITTVIGRTYYVTYQITGGTSTGNLYIGTASGGFENYAGPNQGVGSYTVAFVATATTTFVRLGNSVNTSGATFIVDNISTKEITAITGMPSTYTRNNGGVFPPRFDYDPVTLAAKGLLVEEQRTNILLQSQTFDNVYWTPTGATVSANTTTAPDGAVSADSLVEDTSTAVHRIYAAPACSASTAYTYTAYIKAAGRTEVRLLETTLGGAVFNLSTVAIITTDAGVTASIQDAGNGWRRCRITATTGAAQTLFVAQIQASAAGNTTYTGNGTTALYLYGAQLEAGAFATSYIPTVASQVTRTGDQCSIVAPNFAPWYNQSAGTFVFEGDSSNLIEYPYAVLASDGTFNNRFGMYRAVNSVAAIIASSGVTQLDMGAGSVVANVPFKIAVAAQTNSGNFSFNGSIGTDDTSITMPTVNRLSLASGPSGTLGQINGHIRSIRYYPTRLTNAQLQALTA